MRNSALDVHGQAPGLDYLLVDGNKCVAKCGEGGWEGDAMRV